MTLLIFWYGFVTILAIGLIVDRVVPRLARHYQEHRNRRTIAYRVAQVRGQERSSKLRKIGRTALSILNWNRGVTIGLTLSGLAIAGWALATPRSAVQPSEVPSPTLSYSRPSPGPQDILFASCTRDGQWTVVYGDFRTVKAGSCRYNGATGPEGLDGTSRLHR